MATHDATTTTHARSTAGRLLGGSAAATVHAYRLGESLPIIAHGLTDDGCLVVAAYPTGALAEIPHGSPTDVRMDAVKQAPNPAVTIVAASVHLLGGLSWGNAAETEARLQEGSLPSTVRAAIEASDARLGFIHPERIVLHDMDGATVVPSEELSKAPAVIEDECAAFDSVASYEETELKDLIWAVLLGTVPGIVASKAPLPGACSRTADRVFCVDIDPTGITLMFVGQDELLTVFASFGRCAHSRSEVGAQLDVLMRIALGALTDSSG